MAKVYVPREGTDRTPVEFSDLEKYYEEVKSDDRWPIRALLEFEGCDVIVIRLGREHLDHQVVEVVLGIYDALFGWQSWHFHLNPRATEGPEELRKAVEKEARKLRAILQEDYEGRPEQWQPGVWMRDFYGAHRL